MRAAFGNLVEVTWADGSTSIGRRVANLNIQQLLDSISADDGAMLVRTDVGWLALLAGGDNQVLDDGPPPVPSSRNGLTLKAAVALVPKAN